MNLVSSMTIMLLASLLLYMQLFINLLFINKSVDLHLVAQNFTILAFTLGVTSIACLIRHRFKSPLLFTLFSIPGYLIIFGVVSISTRIEMFATFDVNINEERLATVISVLTIVAMVNFVFVSFLTQPELENKTINDEVAIANEVAIAIAAFKWIFDILILTVVLTILIWLLSGYEGNIINHATVAAFCFAIPAMLKAKMDEFKKKSTLAK